MRIHTLPAWRLAFALTLALTLGACGVGKHQSPVSSDDAAGQTRPVIEEDQPAEYVTKSGDTLRTIAGRPEIYNDPDLWPLLLDANVASLGSKQGKSKLDGGIVLDVPRGQGEDALADAREKSRQAVVSSKGVKPRPTEEPMVTHAKPSPPAKKPAVTAGKPAAASDNAALPVPKTKKGGGLLPVLFFLLLLLAALAAVLYYFTKRDQKDQDA
jgi:hypothetical protein